MSAILSVINFYVRHSSLGVEFMQVKTKRPDSEKAMEIFTYVCSVICRHFFTVLIVHDFKYGLFIILEVRKA